MSNRPHSILPSVIKHLFVIAAFGLVPILGHAESVAGDAPLYVFDLAREVEGYDLADAKQRRAYYDLIFLVSSLQGVVNRDEPRLYVNFFDVDSFWWKQMRSSGAWLEDREFERIRSLPALLKQFEDEVRGFVVYDESVPATSAAAATVAGVEDWLVLRYDPDSDSIYSRLTSGQAGAKHEVRLSMVDAQGQPLFTGRGTIPWTDLPSTGSAKNDVYRWLIENYLKAGKINPLHFGYYLDAYWLENWNRAAPENHTLTNLDYIIAQQGMVFDLHFEAGEAPVDDPGQRVGTDFETIQLMLATANELTGGEAMIGMHGFVPWAFKYTDRSGGAKNAVAVEWRKSQVVSAYNTFVDADALSYAGMANASFFQHFPLPEFIPQAAPEPTEDRLIREGVLNRDGSLKDAIYYAHYAGDYDATAWVYRKMPEIWTDRSRGRLPLTWPINPNLAQRFPFGMLWVRETATENDVFVAGDSGAGYVNVHQLSEPRQFSGLPSGVLLWERWNTEWYRQWDLDTTGFIIDGHVPFMKEDALAAYARFSPGGMGTQVHPPAPVFEGMPMLRIGMYFNPADSPDFLDKAYTGMSEEMDAITTLPAFQTYRSVLWKPADFVELEKRLDRTSGLPPRILVDQRTLLWLYKHHVNQGRK